MQLSKRAHNCNALTVSLLRTTKLQWFHRFEGLGYASHTNILNK